jgi:hypothetical protein
LRLASINGPLNTENFDALEAGLKGKLTKTHRDYNVDVTTYLGEFWDKLYIVLKYYDEIFKDIDHKKAWIDVDTDHFGVYSGLLTFVRGKADYSKHIKSAQTRFSELCKKHLPRKNKLINGGK